MIPPIKTSQIIKGVNKITGLIELKAQTATHMMSREEDQRIHLKIGRDTNQEVTMTGMEDKNTTETSQTSTMEDNLTGTPMATTGVGVVQIPLQIPLQIPIAHHNLYWPVIQGTDIESQKQPE